MHYKLLICYITSVLFISIASISQHTAINIQQDNDSLNKAVAIEDKISDILGNIDFSNAGKDSISSIFMNKKTSLQDFYAALTEINKLKLVFFNNKIDQIKLSENYKNLKIQNNIARNGSTVLDNNFGLIKKESNKNKINPSTLYQNLKKIQSSCINALKIIQNIDNKDAASAYLFKEPIDIELLSEYYNINTEILSKLLTSNNDSTNHSLPKPGTMKKIVKGYSPFSDVYKEFLVFVDSIGLFEKDIQEPKSVKEPPAESTGLKSGFKKNTSLDEDTLFHQAIEDSLFPNELIKKFDKESLKRYWAIYKKQWDTTSFKKIDKGEVTLAQNNISHQTEANILNTETETPQLDKETDLESIAETNEKNQTFFEKEKTNISKTIITKTKTSLTPDEETYYVVQIAASRTPIPQTILNKLYQGDDSLTKRKEDGWYKYQHSKTMDYELAKETVKKSNIEGAFIVAYNKNEKQVLWKTPEYKRYYSNLAHLTFVVQVAATKEKLNTLQRAKIQKDAGGFTREIKEDGWYKYQLVIGSSYAEALRKCKQIGINISFPVAYYNNKKIPMTEAIKIYKKK